MAEAEAPLYIRWGPDRSLYAIELKLDLVDRIRAALISAENSDAEIGGVLIGSLPTAYSSTIRIEDIELIERSPQDGATFMLDPGQHDRFSEIRWRTRTRERVPVGLFRSHLRPGLLRPSLADRTLLSNEFTGPVYALLLVQGKEPYHAGIFVAAHGQLPVEPSIREFTWEDAEFRELPEIDPDTAPQTSTHPPAIQRRGPFWPALAAFGVGLGAGALVWFAPSLGLPLPEAAGSPDVQLNAIAGTDSIRFTWNHQAPLILRARAGTLTVKTAGQKRSLQLPPSELRSGSVLLEKSTPEGEVTLVLEQPGPNSVRQTVYWHNP